MYHFLRFPGFLSKACTLSYDDGVIEDEKLIGIMRKYGLKGTFNIDSKNLGGANGRCLTSDEIKNIYGNDMEIAVHGYEHICIPYVLPEMAMREVIADRENLEKTFGRIVRGMAYPYGDYDDKTLEILRLSGIVYSGFILERGFICMASSMFLFETWVYICVVLSCS